MDGKVAVVEKVAAEMMKRGVCMQAWISHFVIVGPLIIEEWEIDFAVEQLDASLAMADAAIAGQGTFSGTMFTLFDIRRSDLQE